MQNIDLAPELSPQRKATVLVEALPWLRRFRGSIIVIRYGGSAVVDEGCRHAFVQDLLLLHSVGISPVVVHGGGGRVPETLRLLGIGSIKVGAESARTPETEEVVRMMLAGHVGRDLVGRLNQQDAVAVGLSGEDGGLFRLSQDGAEVDADPPARATAMKVNVAAVMRLVEAGLIPVVAAIAPNGAGESQNVNADLAAAQLAVELAAAKFVVLTDVEGLYADWPDRTSLRTVVSADELEIMLPYLEDGIRPKMEACLRVIRSGVLEATVIDGRVEHCLLLEVFTPEGVGTMVVSGAGA